MRTNNDHRSVSSSSLGRLRSAITPVPLLGVLLPAVLLLAGCAQFPVSPVAGTPSPAEVEAQPEAETQTAAAAPQAIPEPQEEPEPDKLYEWNGNGRNISHVVIDTNAQRARFYDGEEQVGWTTIASGVSAHPTPSGEFEVIEKVAKKRSNLYGRIYNAKGGLHKRNAHSSDPIPPGGKFVGARMPHFMRMTYDGVGMHAGAIPRPGQPASHGCIRLPDEIASNLFAHTDIGTRVTVIGQGPDYGNYAERIRRQREEERLNRAAVARAEARNRGAEAGSVTASTSTGNTSASRAEQPATLSAAEGGSDTASPDTASSETASPETASSGVTTTNAANAEATDPTRASDGQQQSTGAQANAGASNTDANQAGRDAGENASSSRSPSHTPMSNQEETATTQPTERSGDPDGIAAESESAPAADAEPASSAANPSGSSPRLGGSPSRSEAAERNMPSMTPSQATTPAPEHNSQERAPPTTPGAVAPSIRSADQDGSAKAENEQT